MSLFSELRRRNVFRVAAAYLVVSWLLTEVVTTLMPVFGAPEWVAKVIVAVIALGFVPAIIFSWVYELTPEGLQKEKDVPPDRSITSHTARKLDYITIAAIVAAIAFVAWARLGPDPVQVQQPAPVADMASVAVLPFVNMSGNEDNEYFSDGLTETLLHMLAQVPELKVAARTSSFAFKGKDQDVRLIANALGVAHVLEGSVQRAGGRVRITAQLIRAVDGTHVWSERYDRTLDDIFRIQDEIANRVRDALTKSLIRTRGGRQMAGVGTDDVEAYDLYLKAIREQNKESYSSLQVSESLLKDALAKDPAFLDAKTQLVSNYVRQAQTGLRQWESTNAEVIALLEQVLESRPADVRARVWMLVARRVRANLAGEGVNIQETIDEMRALVAEAPSDVEPKQLLLTVLAQENEQDEALALMQDLLALDPLNPAIHRDIGFAYTGMKSLDNARAALERSLELEPDQPLVHSRLGTISLLHGDAVGRVRHHLDAHEIDKQDHEYPGEIAVFLYRLGLPEEGDRFRARSISIAPTSPMARVSELYRAICFESEERQIALARQMIEDDVETRKDAWDEALFTLFETAEKQGASREALEFVEKQIPGFLNYEQPAPLKVVIARISAFIAFYHTESSEELRQRMAHLEPVLNKLWTGGGSPVLRMQALALRGETEAAIDVALTEIFSKPAIVYLDIDRNFDLHFVAAVAADPRIREALKRWREDKAKAAEEVRKYLENLEQAYVVPRIDVAA